METSMEQMEASVMQERREREESVLAKMFDAFCPEQGPDDPETEQIYDAIYQALEDMSQEKQDWLLYQIALLCRRHEKNGFILGMRTEARRREELG